MGNGAPCPILEAWKVLQEKRNGEPGTEKANRTAAVFHNDRLWAEGDRS